MKKCKGKYCVAFPYLEYCYGKDVLGKSNYIDLFTLKQAKKYIKKHKNNIPFSRDMKIYKLVKV